MAACYAGLFMCKDDLNSIQEGEDVEFEYQMTEDFDPISIQAYLKNQGYSNKIIRTLKIDPQAGVYVNGLTKKMYEKLQAGDLLSIVMPQEPAHPYIQAVEAPLHILFEDDHLLIINKAAGLLSNPSFYDPEESVSNRVLHYYQSQAYDNQTIHLVTRLDRYSSGILIFAKHKYSHSLMDRLLRDQNIDRIYLAATPPSQGILEDHGCLDFPIGRSPSSIIERQVSPDGKVSLTEYWRINHSVHGDLFKVRLHTGRTHQIRVHFSHVGLSLLGDDLYGQGDSAYFQRQALHCWQSSFVHPITGDPLNIEAPLPDDFENFLSQGFIG